METATKATGKETIISAMYKWIAQRPKLDWRDYGYDPRTAMPARNAEMRNITQQRRDAGRMIRFCEIRDSIDAESLSAAFQGNGRLTWDGKAFDYIVGQYWPTEYRAAVCRQLANLIWKYLRDSGYYGARLDKEAAGYLGRGCARRWLS